MKWLRPASLEEALTIRGTYTGYVLLSGATDYMVGALERRDPEGVIDLFGLPELVGVTERPGAIRIAAGTTYADILRSDLVRTELPLLWQAVREIGAVQIQERGTIGGNIGTSSPVGDTLPALLALDAVIELASAKSPARDVPYESYCTGYRKTAMATDEIIVGVRIPKPAVGTKQSWRKVGTRKAQAISKVMFAGLARLDSSGRVAHSRIALGAVADRPIRLSGAEQLLLAEKPSAELAGKVAAVVAAALRPIDDVRSTADYRRTVASNMVRSFVESLI